MKELTPLSDSQFNVLLERFHQYMVLGGMPEIVKLFVNQKNYSGTLEDIWFYKNPFFEHAVHT